MMNADDVIEVLNALEAAGVAIWVEGGWGIDALLGQQSRPHDDLDLLTPADDIEPALRATHQLGFRIITDERPQGFVLRDASDRRLDFHPVRVRSDGSAVQAIRDQGDDEGEWVFTAPGLQGRGVIGGRSVRCLTAEEQSVRASDQVGAAGYTPDETDRRDMRLLHERFGITLPYPYDSDGCPISGDRARAVDPALEHEA